jgi:hypothetical protein
MSFNKCFLNQEKLQKIYEEEKSPERIRKYLNAYDCFFCSDDFSSQLSRDYGKLSDEEITNIFENL